MFITAKLLQKADFIIRSPLHKGHAIKGVYSAIVHRILKIPFSNSLILLMEILSDVPLEDGSACILLFKPVLYLGNALILRPPAFDVEDISRKNVLYAKIFLLQSHIKPQSDDFFSLIHAVFLHLLPKQHIVFK